MAYCINCGQQIADGVRYCPSCGTSLDNTLPVQSNVTQRQQQPQPTIVFVQTPQSQYQEVYIRGADKSKGITLLLCFFLGGFGAHQFYVGNTVKGVAYICFCWACFITAFISIIDFIIFLCMSEERFHQKYDKRY